MSAPVTCQPCAASQVASAPVPHPASSAVPGASPLVSRMRCGFGAESAWAGPWALEQLLPLARVHGVTLDELVDAPPTGDPRLNLRPVAGPDGSTILPLTRRPGGIQAYKFILPKGRDGQEPQLRTHEGYDCAYVLNGTLRLVLGEHDLILRPGEAVEFDTRTPHWLGATSAGPVEFLSLIGKQGQRTHVRAAPKRDS